MQHDEVAQCLDKEEQEVHVEANEDACVQPRN